MNSFSFVWGLIFALVAGLGAWLQLEVGILTVQLIDFLWLATLISAGVRLATGGKLPSLTVWRGNVAGYTFSAFWLTLAVAPILGIIFNRAPLASISSTLRFLMYFSFPLLLHGLRLDYRAFFQGFLRGTGIAIVLNFSYGALQLLEFNRIIPFGSLPHHGLSGYLSGSRFNDWGRAAGLFLSGNHLGYYGLFGVTVFWSQFLKTLRFPPLLLTVLAFLLAILGNSRSAWLLSIVCMFFIFIYGLFVRRRVRFRVLVFTSTAFLLGAAAIFLLFGSATLREAVNASRYARVVTVITTGNITADNSLNTRLEQLWPSALKALKEYPLGYGAEPSRFLTGTIDSAWLTYLVQGSAPLVLIFLLFLTGAMITGTRGITMGQPHRELAGMSLTALSLALAFGSFLLSPLHVPSLALVFIGLHQVTAGTSNGVRNIEPETASIQ